MADDGPLRALVADHSLGVLTTIKRDGRPQLSNVTFHADTAVSAIRVSITEPRAKTQNMRRDPRVSLYVGRSDGWAYAVVEGSAELTAPARDPHDDVVEGLIELYLAVQGEHPDWDEYRAAMVRDQRVLLTIRTDRVYGMAGV